MDMSEESTKESKHLEGIHFEEEETEPYSVGAFLPLCPIEGVKYSQDKIKQDEGTKKQSPNQSWKGLYNITVIRFFIRSFRNEHYFITIRG